MDIMYKRMECTWAGVSGTGSGGDDARVEFFVEAMDMYVCEIPVEKLRLRVVSQLKACFGIRAGAGKA